MAASPPSTIQRNIDKELPKGGLYHCNCCKRDITNQIRIKCAVCTDFDLCLDCFSVGVELSPHKNNHPYRIMDDMSAPLFTEGWGGDEELLLLEGIEMFGLGNWSDVAAHVGTKSQWACEYHYWSVYIDVPTFPNPTSRLKQPIKREHRYREDVGESTEEAAARERERKREREAEEANETQEYVLKYREDPYDKEKATEAQKTIVANYQNAIGSEVGFLPLRGDFDIEFDNTAEETLGDMEITENDTPQEKELKLKMLAAYEFRLQERNRRKRFAIDRGLIDYKRLRMIHKKRAADEKEIYDRYKPFARFASSLQQYDEFVLAVLEERRIRRQIRELQIFRENGITSFADAKKFDLDRRKRESAHVSKWSSASSAALSSYFSGPMRTTRAGAARASDMYEMALTPSYSFTTNIASPDVKAKGKRSQHEQPLDISNMEGVEILSHSERDLCSQLRIPPKQYFVIKDSMLCESFRLGHLSRATAKLLLKIDEHKLNRLYDFFVASNWIHSSPLPNAASNTSSSASNNTTTQEQPPHIRVNS